MPYYERAEWASECNGRAKIGAHLDRLDGPLVLDAMGFACKDFRFFCRDFRNYQLVISKIGSFRKQKWLFSQNAAVLQLNFRRT